jgi:hypothetical protein
VYRISGITVSPHDFLGCSTLVQLKENEGGYEISDDNCINNGDAQNKHFVQSPLDAFSFPPLYNWFRFYLVS